jgi:nucleotide-binding universal stress UspA family protein
MVIRVIHAPLTGAESDHLVFAAAGAVARRFAAHVDVVFQRADPRAAMPYLGEGISGDVAAQFVESAEKENTEAAQRAFTEFNAWRDRAGLTLLHAPGQSAVATCSWRDGMNGTGDAMLADLVIAAHAGARSALESESRFESLLMRGGRPVLLVRSRTGENLGNHVLIAWNGSAESARAISAAMPFLHAAQSVSAITVRESGMPDEALGENLARYLAWHGIAVETRLAADDGGPVGAFLLQETARRSAELLVMGAYGHSRLREYILGGATRFILDEGAIPVLMTH